MKLCDEPCPKCGIKLTRRVVGAGRYWLYECRMPCRYLRLEERQAGEK